MNLIRLPQVMRMVGLRRTAIYRNISKGLFPAPVKQVSASFWIEEEVMAYLRELVQTRDAARADPQSWTHNA